MIQAPKAFVLAAGFGTRLKPWTDEKAKPLIPVAGVEALFFAIYRLSQVGIAEIVINAHYKAEQLKSALDHFSSFFPNISFSFSFEKEILGTGGGILKILSENDFPTGLLVLNGDTLGSFDLQKLFQQKTSSMAVSFNKKFLEAYNPVYLTKDNEWSYETTEYPAHFLGSHFLSAEDLKLLKEKRLRTQEIDLFSGIYWPLLENKRKISAVEFLKNEEDFWFDLNTKEFHKLAHRELSTKYFKEWESVLKMRHPHLEASLATKFWPLTSKKDS